VHVTVMRNFSTLDAKVILSSSLISKDKSAMVY